MSLTLWYIVMVAGLIGMVWCAKSQKRVAKAKLYAIICLVVVVISAIMALSTYFSDPENERALANAKQFDRAKLNQIAEFVNKNYAGKKAVILIHQDMIPNPDADYVRLDQEKELKSFLKGVTVLDTVVIRPPKNAGGEDSAVPEEVSYSAPVFNEKFEECRKLQPDVIINLAGLPMGEESRKLKVWRWKSKNDPKLVLSEVNDIGICFEPADLLTVLDCVILSRNDRKFNYLEDTASKDLKEAFDSLYVLVTKDNLGQLKKDNVITIYEPSK